MKHAQLKDMINGWFVGAFSPTAMKTHACEVAVKKYRAGDFEASHFHKVATEITLIISGNVIMCGKSWGPGDIIIIEPGEATAFKAVTDAINVVVKVPGALNDKYIIEKQ